MTDPTMTRPKLTTEQWRRVFAQVDQSDLANESTNADPEVAVALKFFESSKDRIAHESFSFAGLADEIAGATSVTTGQRCGNYVLIEPIGRGGMGSVWRARRSDGLYEAEVAVKLLGSLALARKTCPRMRREGELLARLTHPNIARLLDAGVTEDGQRFLVLELIRGVDIRDACGEKPLRDRLIVFRQLLSAVAFAHSQFVLHRDIKPSNVLVDADGQVKLLDFGVAKWLTEEDTEGLTRDVGAAYTEAYAAPEQVNGLPVGVAADVFSLGSVLCELLTRSRIEWLLPKRRWRVDGSNAKLATSLVNLSNDLRLIVEKAISPSSTERYSSVVEFDDDLRRYLNAEPIRARRPSRLYLFSKFVERYRWGVAIGSAATVATLTSLGFAVYQLHEAREHERLSTIEANKATAISNFTTSLFTVLDPRVASPIDRSKLTAKQILDMGRERIRTELRDQPDTRLALLGTLAEMYGRLEFESEFESLNEERIALARERHGEHHTIVYESVTKEYWSDIYRGNYAKAKLS
jgi:eukaryotic-like serine/threonine-protein kinase